MCVKVNKDVRWMAVLDTDEQPHVTSPVSLCGETLHAGVKLTLMPLCSLFLIIAKFGLIVGRCQICLHAELRRL